MLGRFIWNELATTDVARAKAFYEQTLGWTFEPCELPDGAYWAAKAGDTIVGGVEGMAISTVDAVAGASTVETTNSCVQNILLPVECAQAGLGFRRAA
jgi:predicted enzyme related to lactoylglutathione lyase